MIFQTVLHIKTLWPTLRSEAVGWSIESGRIAHVEMGMRGNKKIPVGQIGSPKGDGHLYPTVLHALGDGFKLITIPSRTEYYEWWLVKEEESDDGFNI